MAKPKKWRKPAAKIVERLVTDNIKLAHSLAFKYTLSGYWDADDALSLAMDGLLIAANRWDKKFGVPFGTYAGMRINWRFAREQKRRSLRKHGGHATFINLDEPLTSHKYDSASQAGTVATHIPDPNAAPPCDLISDGQILDAVLVRVEHLPKELRETVKMRFGLNGFKEHTLREAGVRLGITGECVRLRMNKALEILQKELRRSETMNELKLA